MTPVEQQHLRVVPILLLFTVAILSPPLGAQDRGTQEQARSRAPETALEALDQAVRQATRQFRTAVVGVEVDAKASTRTATRDTPAFLVPPDSPASGVLIAPHWVLTCSHRIAATKSVRIVSAEGGRLPAEVTATDAQLGLALLHLPIPIPTPHNLQAQLTATDDAQVDNRPRSRLNTEKLKPGSWLAVIGFGPQGQPSINAGIVSATDRFDHLLQTDAAVTHTNRGALVVDLDGRFAGVVVHPSPRVGINSGVAFVAPASAISKVLPTLLAGESRDKVETGFLGVQFGKEHLEPTGVELARVVDDSAAAKAGLRAGDVITHVGATSVFDAPSLSRSIRKHPPGDTILIVAQRDGHGLCFEATLGKRSQ